MADRLAGDGGANLLRGGAGDDFLLGGEGADLFEFGAGSGVDTIGDFVAGTDRIDLAAYGFASFAAVLAATSDVPGSGATIALGGGNLLVLSGVAKAQLSAGDFGYAAQRAGEGKAQVMAPEATGRGAPVMAWDGACKDDAAGQWWLDEKAASVGLVVFHSGEDAGDPLAFHGALAEGDPFHFA